MSTPPHGTGGGRRPNARQTGGDARFDIFLSHASEDKDSIARALYEALRAAGISVWFDEATLTLGDNLSQKIDDGLRACRYGIVILSPRFFGKNWPKTELDSLLARENLVGNKTILPVWHEVDAADVAGHSALLASRLAVRSSQGVAAIVSEVQRALNAAGHGVPTARTTTPRARRWPRFGKRSSVSALLAIAVAVGTWHWTAAADRLVPGYGPAVPTYGCLNGRLSVSYGSCSGACLPGVTKVAELRGSLGVDGFAALYFWKPGTALGWWYGSLPGPTLRVRMAGYGPNIGVEVTVKDSNDYEARFRCALSSDGTVRDYVLPRAALDAQRVDLSQLQLVGLGPSTSAKTPPGNFQLKVLGVVSTSQMDGLEECVGLLKPASGADDQRRVKRGYLPRSSASTAGKDGVVETLSDAHLFDEPDVNARSVQPLNEGSRVRVLRTEGDWYWVETDRSTDKEK